LRDGYVGGAHHFGRRSTNVEPVMERGVQEYPEAAIVRRPSTAPFAA